MNQIIDKINTSEAKALADAVLKAAGSGLRHYTMAKTREAIITAVQNGIEASRARLVAALTRCAELLADYDEAEGEEGEAYREAIAAIAEAKGLAA